MMLPAGCNRQRQLCQTRLPLSSLPEAMHHSSCPALPPVVQHLSWSKDHAMMLPPAVHTGMVAYVLGLNGTAEPACIVSVKSSLEAGAFSPVVRVR